MRSERRAGRRRSSIVHRGPRTLTAVSLLLGSWGVWGCAAVAPHAETRPPGTAVHPTATPTTSTGRAEVGLASWYGEFHQGQSTASGETFDMRRLTAAHRTLPLGTRLRVTNLENGRVVHVRVNDRGPYEPGRVIDVSRGAARVLGIVEQGVVPVRLEVEDGDRVVTARATSADHAASR
jgi:rare lipoprotein A (peptidoglycan hydrolase)